MNEIIYEKVGERLKYSRELRNISLEKAGEVVGVHKSTILRWERGNTEKFKIPTLEILAQLYNVNPAWLMGYDVPMERTFDNNIVGLPQKAEGSAIVLIYGTIPAGIPMECIEDIIDTEEIPTDMLKGGKQYFGLKINGDSMEPDYLDGDIVIFQKQDDCENGDDCCIMVNGSDGTFKRVFKNENGIVLQPLNNKYEPLIFSNEQIEELPVRILGVFEELRRKKRRK